MILILLSIVFTTAMFTCFKYFPKFHINTFHAILVNYFVAAITSYLFADKGFKIQPTASWFTFSAFLGLLFIITVATSIAAQKVSLIVSMIASKMSLVIPLTYAVLFIGEPMTSLKLITILLAMIGVVLTVLRFGKPQQAQAFHARSLLLIAAVFVGSGMVDSSFKFIEINFYTTIPPQYVMMVCYSGAAAFGLIFYMLRNLKTKQYFTARSVVAGVILGILNYFAFYFVLEALHNPSLPSTIVFPIVNVGVLMLSTFVAMALFNERLQTLNYIGVGISILSILLLVWQHYAI